MLLEVQKKLEVCQIALRDYLDETKNGVKTVSSIDEFQLALLPLAELSSDLFIEAELLNQIDIGTHTIFIGKIIDADILTNDKCMTYEYYHLIKGGKSPKNAPTYIKDEKMEIKEEKKMNRYICKVCGYVYDPEKGDPENGIKPGTLFEDLPDDWVCPVCGASKNDFDKE